MNDRHTRIFPLLLIVYFFWGFPVLAQGIVDVNSRINSILSRKELKGCISAVIVKDLERDSLLFSRYNGLNLHPASTAKLYLASAYLLAENPLDSVRTVVTVSRKPGFDLITLYGGGDPLFSLEDMEKVVHSLQRYPLRKHRRVLVDCSLFDSIPYGPGWVWDDLPYYYAPPVLAFAVNHNTFQVTVSGTPRGARVQAMPRFPGVAVESFVTIAEKDSLLFLKQPCSNKIIVKGTIRSGSSKKERLSLWAPPEIALNILTKSTGADYGLVAYNAMKPDHGADTLLVISRSVRNILGYMLVKSDNLSAEMLCKLLAVRSGERPGSLQAGTRRIKDIIASAGLDTGRVVLADASGLSCYDLTTPGNLHQLLESMWRSESQSQLLDLLPRGGKDGTLRYRFRQIPGAEYIHAKTGTITGASMLAGYVAFPAKARISFVIFMQNFIGRTKTIRSIQDRIVNAIAQYAIGTGKRGEQPR